MRLIGIVLVLGVTLAATAGEGSTSPSLLAKLWPKEVPFPAGMHIYRKSEHAQNTVILNGYDSHTIVHRNQDAVSGVNPNRIFPWRVSGGMDHAAGWTSHAAVAFPESKPVQVFNEYIEAGARRPLPRTSWTFPVGTVFADILSENGRTFELRLLTKRADGWRGRVAWESEHKPPGYRTPDRKCFDCHSHAGGWLSYGTLLRGGDRVFSWSPLKEGTLYVRRDLLDAGTVVIQPR